MTAFLFASLAFSTASAQSLDLPIASPKAMVMAQVGTTELSVSYFSPGVKGRVVFGELVPYGEMWRTGANSGTQLSSTTDFKLGDLDVEAGTYMVYTIPGEDSWTVVLNEDLNGRPWRYDEKLEVGRIEVEPVESPERERLTFLFSDVTDTSASLELDWAGVRVPIPIEVPTVDAVKSAAEQYAGGASRKLADAAVFLAENGETEQAQMLADKAMALEENWYNAWQQAVVLKAAGEAKDAYAAAKTAQKLGKKAENFFWKDRVEAALEDWPKK
jgi:hypothetical protein